MNCIRSSLLILALTVTCATTVSGGPYTDDLSKCLFESLSILVFRIPSTVVPVFQFYGLREIPQ